VIKNNLAAFGSREQEMLISMDGQREYGHFSFYHYEERAGKSPDGR
jgi:hypothetical protein